jgi:cytochrome c oxidase subunit IV
MSHHASTLDAVQHRAHADSKGHHGNPVRTYIVTLTALLILTVVTVLVAQFDLGEANVAAAIGIATLKASLVALFFMHLLHDRPMNAVILCTALVMLGLLFLFSFMDSGTRHTLIPQNGMAPAGSDFNRAPTQTQPYGKLPPKTNPAPIETPR